MRLVIAAIAVMASPATGQSICMGYADAVESLYTQHGESIAMSGLVDGGNLIVTFTNPETGDWTMIIVRPDGIACGLAHGASLELHKPRPNL